MSVKLKKGLAVVIFLLVSVAISTIALEKVSKGKIDGFSSKALSLIKTKYGIDAEITGLNFSIFPPKISVKKSVFSLSGNELVALEECSLKNFASILFSNEKRLNISCSKSKIHVDRARAVQIHSNSKEKKEPNNVNRENYPFSLHFTTDADFVFGSVTQCFKSDIDLTPSGGKALFKEVDSLDDGTVEILFSLENKSATIRFDGIDLEDFREIIKNRTSFDISSGKISAFAEISKKEEKFFIKNDMTIHDLAFFHPLIDSLPFTLPLFRFIGDINFDKKENSLSTKDAKLSLGGINAIFSGTYSKNSKEFSIKTESAKLNKLETLIHDAVFEGYLFGGTLELLAVYSQEGEEPPLFSIEGNLIEPKQLSERFDYLKQSFEYIWTNEDGSEKKIVVGERNSDFTPISIIPDHLVWAVVVSEDAGFFVHKGIDFQELDAAVKDNIKKHKLRGGSTITQQLAKNLFLNRDKTLLRKFREVLLAIELDAALSKERLLEIYFNIIEWAPGVFGISQAAYYYFGKLPHQLTPLESAYLASVIPGPAKYHYMFLSKNVTENWYKSLYRILNIMNETGHLSTDDYFEALKQSIVFRENETEE